MNSCIACDFRVSTDYFGDRVLPFVLQSILKQPIARRASGGDAVFGTGSNLSGVRKDSIVWGAGFREDSAGIPGSLRSAKKLGFVGLLSAQKAEEADIDLPDSMAIGNAFELLPEILPQSHDPEQEFGVIAHPRDLDHPVVTSCEAAGGLLISPFSTLESVVRSIHRCRTVLTTSLEGLMLCDAYGIPNRWIQIERKREISDFPFRDYYSGRESAPDSPSLIHHYWDYQVLIGECRSHGRDPQLPRLTRKSIEACQGTLPERQCRVIFASDEERKRRPIPVFVISFNRLKCLKRLVASLEQSSQPVEIVIHDNGSDYPPLLEYLDTLEAEGVLVARNPKLQDNPKGLEQINETIDRYFKDFSEPIPYAVTDPDISFENSDPAFLELYGDLLSRFPGVECIGPQLPIHDIPDSFSLRHWVIQRQKHYWKRPPEKYVRWRDRDVYLRTNTVIDTTFALFRAGERFKRLAKAIRVYAPFDARHLDWYQTETDDEMLHYQKTASDISHWQGEYSRKDRFRDFRMGPTTIFITEPEESAPGELQIKRIDI